jgi:hypothetical protein
MLIPLASTPKEKVFADAVQNCLGNNTKSQATPVNTSSTVLVDLHKKRNELFKLQGIVKDFLRDLKLNQGKTVRTLNCLSAPIDKDKGVTVFTNADQHCKYKGLQLCGSRWVCPICSNKLLESSRQDILKASNQHLETGGGFVLMTVTIPHTIKDKLQHLSKLQTKALNKFHENGSVKKIFKSLGKIGSIRSFENKHGKNGWHPHQHFLIYIKSPILNNDLRQSIEASLLRHWQNACLAVGLGMPNKHGLDFKTCTDPLKASDYIVKDSFEITYSNAKGSKSDSINPFDLLSYEPYKYGSRKALFQDYYLATKGKSLIYWSRGLKKRFGILDKQDEELITDELEQFNIPVVEINVIDWGIIRRFDLRVELLDFTEDYLKSANLISITDYDSYISLFFDIYFYSIKNKKYHEPEPLFKHFDIDDKLNLPFGEYKPLYKFLE